MDSGGAFDAAAGRDSHPVYLDSAAFHGEPDVRDLACLTDFGRSLPARDGPAVLPPPPLPLPCP